MLTALDVHAPKEQDTLAVHAQTTGNYAYNQQQLLPPALVQKLRLRVKTKDYH